MVSRNGYRAIEMYKPMNMGLIGCGRAAERLYLPVLSHLLSDCQLIAVADPLCERREFISSKIPSCLAYESAEELMQETRLDAVIITTPPETHIDIAKLALRSGIPALIEKPLAPSMDGIKELEALVTALNGTLMLGFNRRFWKPVCRLREMMRNLQHPDTVYTELLMKTDIQAWSPICGVNSPLDDLGSHQLDLLRYIFDSEIIAISANWTGMQEIQMRARLANGVRAHCLAAYSNVSDESITVITKNQKYRVHMGSERVLPAAGVRFLFDFYDMLKRHLKRQRSAMLRSYEQQLLTFLTCIRTGTTQQPGIADGIAAIQAVEAVRQSVARDGLEFCFHD